MKRAYWTLSAILIGTGLLGLVLVFIFPPEHFDQEGRLIGEMPPEFGIALALAVLGLHAALAGAVVLGALRLWRWLRRRSESGWP